MVFLFIRRENGDTMLCFVKFSIVRCTSARLMKITVEHIYNVINKLRCFYYQGISNRANFKPPF